MFINNISFRGIFLKICIVFGNIFNTTEWIFVFFSQYIWEYFYGYCYFEIDFRLFASDFLDCSFRKLWQSAKNQQWHERKKIIKTNDYYSRLTIPFYGGSFYTFSRFLFQRFFKLRLKNIIMYFVFPFSPGNLWCPGEKNCTVSHWFMMCAIFSLSVHSWVLCLLFKRILTVIICFSLAIHRYIPPFFQSHFVSQGKIMNSITEHTYTAIS